MTVILTASLRTLALGPDCCCSSAPQRPCESNSLRQVNVCVVPTLYYTITQRPTASCPWYTEGGMEPDSGSLS